MAREERVVEYFVVAIKKDDDAQAELAYAYPEDTEDCREFCENVTMFMFPHAFGVDWNKRGLPPPPIHNLFALTDVNGDHLYGASLCFYETLQSPDAVGDEDNNNNNSSCTSSEAGTVQHQHQAKSICLLSRRPFYTQLLRTLEQLFLLGIQQCRVNHDISKLDQGFTCWHGVENTLCNLFHEVPVPFRGLAVQLSVADVEVALERPVMQEFPFDMDAELMIYAFMMVDPKVMAQLYHHVLLEHRILIVGTDSVLVTAIAEAIKCLVFPMTWLHVFIPNVPDSLDLSTLLEAPVPFIAGAHIGQLKHVQIPDNVVKLEFTDGKFPMN
uniref:UDENN domain-containing protein n=1 Tax=Globisporangium ultimum (strain ATCC 200006 / CBS 805.95 / DAOM BR144) TaxID=431595 RepID=K3X217_GLOUD